MTQRTSKLMTPRPMPQVMGIVNVTPDSFSDGGHHAAHDQAIAHVKRLVDEGAQWLDIGGESTRPGAAPVSPDEEWRRIAPVIEAAKPWGVSISVDTRRPEVMRHALERGVDMINDVEALRQPGALEAVVSSSCKVCLMHMQGSPQTMQSAPRYTDVVSEVIEFLAARIESCEHAGIDRHRLFVDPGFGFGKTLEHNVALTQQLESLRRLGVPMLVGWSRKRTLGDLTGRTVDKRLAGSLAAALRAAEAGAAIVRVHDVAETVDALTVWSAFARPLREHE